MLSSQKILITGAAGFVCGYLIEELLKHGYQVIGIDNFSKYGPVKKSFDQHPNYRFIEGDAKSVELLQELIIDCDQLVAGASIIGGIAYFHSKAYDLLAENERILASTFDAAIWAHRHHKLKKINVLSSSMVYESTDHFPSQEGDERRCPPPRSTYGFQKLSCEYFAQGAHEQYGLPYSILRLFNCVGIGETRALNQSTMPSGNVELAMSHVLTDLCQKILKGQSPLKILGSGKQIRHFTYGGDLARGIRMCIENPAATNQDFNLSTSQTTSILELAEMLWKGIHPEKPFHYECDQPFPYDVQRRVPSTEKAKKILGFEALTPLEEVLEMVIPWVCEQNRLGNI